MEVANVPDYEQIHKNYMKKIGELSSEYLNIYNKFDKKMIGERNSVVTRKGYAKEFCRFLRFYNRLPKSPDNENEILKNPKPINEITIENLEDYKTALGDKDSEYHVKATTAFTIMTRMRKLLQFISEKYQLDQDFYTITLPEQPSFELKDEELVRLEEVKRMLKFAVHPRERCLIALMWETGARISELLNLKIKDIQDDVDCMRVKIKTKKTKKEKSEPERSIVILDFQAYVIEWLKAHPFKDEPNHWLFITLKNSVSSKFGDQLDYMSAYSALRKIADRADVKWKSFHKYRHSRITADVKENKLGREFLVMKHGWTKGSGMISRYTHLRDKDLVQAQLEALDIVKKEKVEETEDLGMIECPRCRLMNPKDDTVCSRCATSLTGETVDDKIKRVVNDALGQFLTNFFDIEDVTFKVEREDEMPVDGKDIADLLNARKKLIFKFPSFVEGDLGQWVKKMNKK